MSKVTRFDDTSYDTVVFDEVFFYSVRRLARIKRYCEENPEEIVIATGDTKQLKAIDVISNTSWTTTPTRTPAWTPSSSTA